MSALTVFILSFPSCKTGTTSGHLHPHETLKQGSGAWLADGTSLSSEQVRTHTHEERWQGRAQGGPARLREGRSDRVTPAASVSCNDGRKGAGPWPVPLQDSLAS